MPPSQPFPVLTKMVAIAETDIKRLSTTTFLAFWRPCARVAAAVVCKDKHIKRIRLPWPLVVLGPHQARLPLLLTIKQSRNLSRPNTAEELERARTILAGTSPISIEKHEVAA